MSARAAARPTPRRLTADPPAGSVGDSAASPSCHPGRAASYCFIRLRSTQQRPGLVADRAGPLPRWRAAASSPSRATPAQAQVTPVNLGGRSAAAIFTAVYRGGLVPADRRWAARATSSAWSVACSTSTSCSVARCDSHRDLTRHPSRQDIRIEHAGAERRGARIGQPSAPPTARSWARPARRPAALGRDSHASTFNSSGQWTIRVLGSDAAGRAQSQRSRGCFALLIGLLLTLMAFLLVRVLAARPATRARPGARAGPRSSAPRRAGSARSPRRRRWASCRPTSTGQLPVRQPPAGPHPRSQRRLRWPVVAGSRRSRQMTRSGCSTELLEAVEGPTGGRRLQHRQCGRHPAMGAGVDRAGWSRTAC